MMTSYGFWEGGGEREMTAPLRAAMTRPAAEWTASRRPAAEVLAAEKEAYDAAEAGAAVDGSEEDGRGDDGRSTASPLNYYFFVLRRN
jgi:hypothetical protein